jgi:threonine/homoserine/homoserine lactone efflux protein
MVFANNLFWGGVLGFIGVVIPGLINVTAAKVTLRQGVRAGLLCALGAALVVFVQAKVAVGFAKYLSSHAEVLTNIKKIAILLFVVFSVVFFYQALKPKVRKDGSRYPGTPFLKGVATAGMNIMNIPFYFTGSAYLDAKNLLYLASFSGWGVAFGAFAGSLSGLLLYVYLAGTLMQKMTSFDRGANFFLSGLFLVLAVLQWVQLYFT